MLLSRKSRLSQEDMHVLRYPEFNKRESYKTGSGKIRKKVMGRLALDPGSRVLRPARGRLRKLRKQD